MMSLLCNVVLKPGTLAYISGNVSDGEGKIVVSV